MGQCFSQTFSFLKFCTHVINVTSSLGWDLSFMFSIWWGDNTDATSTKQTEHNFFNLTKLIWFYLINSQRPLNRAVADCCKGMDLPHFSPLRFSSLSVRFSICPLSVDICRGSARQICSLWTLFKMFYSVAKHARLNNFTALDVWFYLWAHAPQLHSYLTSKAAYVPLYPSMLFD